VTVRDSVIEGGRESSFNFIGSGIRAEIVLNIETDLRGLKVKRESV
jgi:hypothetical protein